MRSAKEIRQDFIQFFVEKHGHTFVPSSSVVPLGDETLLFANAGMNQFKDVFLGTGNRPYQRAVNAQKCIRASGKHNDLDDVGRDTYHHTFFEMLGNWSFGDYFKREAIRWGWELLTKVWQLDEKRLHVTVFGGDNKENLEYDEEAAKFWREEAGVPPERIHAGSKKDNFWEMGTSGPCGPCTEVHYDRTPGANGHSLVNSSSPDVIEIWNLVFIQYNRGLDGKLTPLPAKHVDTGMGFERITAILQNKNSNYDTDIFSPLMSAIRDVTGAEPYRAVLKNYRDIAYRVIADHVRTLTFAITDGAVIGPKERDYVLRRILRRAARYGRQHLQAKEPFLSKLVDTVVAEFGDAYPELKRNPDRVKSMIQREEEQFIRTLDSGIRFFQKVVATTRQENRGEIAGSDLFRLHDTYGLLKDIVEQMAEEEGLKIDEKGFEDEKLRAQELSRSANQKVNSSAISGEIPDCNDSAKYELAPLTATILGWLMDNNVYRDGELISGQEAGIFLDKTNFYAEQGGQIGDTGNLQTVEGVFAVEKTVRLGDSILHVGKVKSGRIVAGSIAMAEVSSLRSEIMKNHTATHLLNLALRDVLGEHIEQKGSLVEADRLRFDFSHDQSITSEQLLTIEQKVNQWIQLDWPVSIYELPLEKAKQLGGVRAVFGEKYPDPVRVVGIGFKDLAQAKKEYSIEFCGGTHVQSCSSLGLFKIVSCESIARGVPRITAITSGKASQWALISGKLIDQMVSQLTCRAEELPTRIVKMQDEIKKLQKDLEKALEFQLSSVFERLVQNAKEIACCKIIIGELPGAPMELIKNQIDHLRKRSESTVVIVVWQQDGKVPILVGISDNLVKRKLSSAEIIKPIVEILGGGGSSKRAEFAQSSGKDPGKISQALQKAVEYLHTYLVS